MTWSPILLTLLGLTSVAHSMTMLDLRRKACRFYSSLIGGMGLILCAMIWSALT